MFQGSKVAILSGKVLQGSRIPQLQVSRIARLQVSRVPRFQSSTVDHRGSGIGFQGSKGSRFQASRFQTCKGLGLIHAKQTQELLQFIYRNIMIHNKASTLRLHKVPTLKVLHKVFRFKALRLQEVKLGVGQFHDSRISLFHLQVSWF